MTVSGTGHRTITANTHAQGPLLPLSPLKPRDLSVGMSGPDVTLTQNLLNKNGAKLAADGVFGQHTADAVKGFQARVGLPATGVVDTQTLSALNGQGTRFERGFGNPFGNALYQPGQTAAQQRPATTTPSNTGLPTMKAGALAQANPPKKAAATATTSQTVPTQNGDAVRQLAGVDVSKLPEAQQYDHYKNLATQAGGKWNDKPGAVNLVGIRTPDDLSAGTERTIDHKGSKVTGHGGVYNDTIAAVWTDKNGEKHVKTFNGNTDPSELFGKIDSKDVDKDGKRDVGRLQAGYNEFMVGKRSNGADALVPTANVNMERDMNHDGKFNDGVVDVGGGGQSVLFHNGGGNNSTGSAGCQTIRKDDWDTFWKTVSTGTNNTNIGYTLIQK